MPLKADVNGPLEVKKKVVNLLRLVNLSSFSPLFFGIIELLLSFFYIYFFLLRHSNIRPYFLRAQHSQGHAINSCSNVVQ